MPSAEPPTLNVAIVGGGPGGLGTAIALSCLPNVQVRLYEQARELREIGAGINIGFNCWKILELLGAAEGVRGHLAQGTLHRNGLSGDVLTTAPKSPLPPRYLSRRVRRTRLQSSLVAQVPPGVIHLNHRLVSLQKLERGGVQLAFENGAVAVADLVVGGDGIRSVVRQHLFPEHDIQFMGTTIWRTLIPLSSVAQIDTMGHHTNWWHGTAGHVYTTIVDDPAEAAPGDDLLFEIAARNVIDPKQAKEKRFSWGVPATNARVLAHFTDYDPRVQDALKQVPEGGWREFSAFAGPRLQRLVGWDRVVLIGDASHPLSGAFGSGAAFALEDGWILAQALQYTRLSPDAITHALEIFDQIRSPYYRRMYEFLDQQKANVAKSADEASRRTFDANLAARLKAFDGQGLAWVYLNDIEQVWDDYVQSLEAKD
ncbi:putative FAD-binding monooxygenase [Coleophoma cylindrospora]|uniref:Putative FAD-binding monooxygenase n=1 Tax=Coleophoma cylindrospora TaxID=1849047 RepID=A0A3D8SD55_9HELO|nr:putative FAD-binding monooxygenase [Coleophoma cylindrospora]